MSGVVLVLGAIGWIALAAVRMVLEPFEDFLDRRCLFCCELPPALTVHDGDFVSNSSSCGLLMLRPNTGRADAESRSSRRVTK